MRKLSAAIAATALGLAGAGCGSQAHPSSTTTTTTVRAAPARAVAFVGAHQSSTSTTRTTVRTAPASAVSWAGPVNAPSAGSIVGTWSGHLTPPPGSHASRQHFMVVIDPGERRGTWRTTSTCAGTLRLKDISYGYHHYYRVAGAHPGCAAPGIDCLKRSPHIWSTRSSRTLGDKTSTARSAGSADADRTGSRLREMLNCSAALDCIGANRAASPRLPSRRHHAPCAGA